MQPSAAVTDKQDKEILEEEELRLLHCYWRAANYLCVGMLYRRNNPLSHAFGTVFIGRKSSTGDDLISEGGA